jgi:hypothetical protein
MACHAAQPAGCTNKVSSRLRMSWNAVDSSSASPSRGRGIPLILMLPPRQRDEARALYARAAMCSGKGGGTVIAAMANAEGAKVRGT